MPSSSTTAAKRQQQIYFRSLMLPPPSSSSSGVDSDNESNGESSKKRGDYCPHFLSALQLIAHVLVPVRKALVHFYVSYRNKDVTRLEWLTLLSFGRLFRDLITASSSSGSSVLSGGSGSVNTGAVDEAALKPVSSERFFPVLYTCLLKHDLEKWPKDATEAVRVLLDCLHICCRTLPVTHHVWSALLDKACLGLIVSQTLVGRERRESSSATEVKQRSHTERVIQWCPHVLPIGDVARIPASSLVVARSGSGDEDDDDEKPVPTLQQLLEADCKKRPLSTTSRSYYDFDKHSYDFEVKIPTKFLDPNEKDDDDGRDDGGGASRRKWKTTRSLQFASLTGYLFLGIDRTSKGKLDHSELAVPATLDLTKLCAKQRGGGGGGGKSTLPQPALYDLVGGALHDDGEYVAVLKDFAAVAEAEERKAAAGGGDGDDSDDDEEEEEIETWKLLESEESIPMQESDVLGFLKGEGNDDDDEEDEDSDDEHGPCGTLAVYKLRAAASSSSTTTTTIFDEMNHLLSDIVISQVSGALNSKTDYYIEEEIIEEEIIED